MSTYDFSMPVIGEPALDDLLNDPIVKLLMKKDRVKEKELWPLLRQTGERLDYFLGTHKVA